MANGYSLTCIISFKLIDRSGKTVQYQWSMVNYEAGPLRPPRCLSVKAPSPPTSHLSTDQHIS